MSKFQEPVELRLIEKGRLYCLTLYGPTQEKEEPYGLPQGPEGATTVYPANSFDYPAYWRKVAVPSLWALGKDLLGLYERLGEATRDTPQGVDCKLILNEDTQGFLASALEEHTLEDLAKLSRLAHDVCHFMPSAALRGGSKLPDKGEGYGWKISRALDQAIEDALELPDTISVRQGTLHFSVWDSRGTHAVSWRSKGGCTREALNALLEATKGVSFSGARQVRWKQEEAQQTELDKAMAPYKGEDSRRAYMRPHGTCEDDCKECGGEPLSGCWMDHASGCPRGIELRTLTAQRTLDKLREEGKLPEALKGFTADHLRDIQEALKETRLNL